MGRVNDLLTVLRTAGAQYVVDAGLDPFADAYTTPGKPPVECLGVLVSWASQLGNSMVALPKTGSLSRMVNAAAPSVTLNVWIIECVTVQDDLGHFPSTTDYASDSQRIYDRGEVVYMGFFCDIAHRTLWQGVDVAQPPAETTLGPLTWDEPRGGAQIGRFEITTQIS